MIAATFPPFQIWDSLVDAAAYTCPPTYEETVREIVRVSCKFLGHIHYLCTQNIMIMERKAVYNDYIVRIPRGEDASRLSLLTQSMGWMIISLDNETSDAATSPRKGLASLRGILKSDSDASFDEMRCEALNSKYSLDL